MEARSVQVWLVGDQSSAGKMALAVSVAAVVGPPPVARTVPSGRSVSVWYVRGYFIAAVACQVGEDCVMSNREAMVDEFRVAVSGSTEVPVFRNFPVRYMTELPPSTAAPPTAVHFCVVRYST